MKQYLYIALVLFLILGMVGCGEYTAPPPQPGQDGGGTTEDPPEGTVTDPKDDPNAFTVALRYNGEPYIPSKKDMVTAQWTDGFSFYTAEFGEDGVARVSGLDGDYKVTLKGLPLNRVYDPNAHVATNDRRTVIIDLYNPVRTSGYGVGLYDCISISQTGVYRIQLDSPEHKIYFQYAPSGSGTYSVESWVSTAEGNYNPKVDVYNGTHAYKVFAYTLNDGGMSDGYTQNFKHEVSIAQEHIGTSGQAVFTFAIHADAKDDVWPMYLDFAIKLNGEFELEHANRELIFPEEDFKQTPDYGENDVFMWAETSTIGVDGRFQFDGSMFKLYPVSEGGDGYYHLYDKATGEYGAILYAKITQAHRFTELAFSELEAMGNNALTVNDGTKNYKLLIQGLEQLLYDPLDHAEDATSGSYFCEHECPCRKEGIGVCGTSCEECLEGCRHLPDEIVAMIDTDPYDGYDPSPEVEKVMIDDTHGNQIMIPKFLAGYATYTNSDGVYAVTEELKTFLQGFSIAQRYFADGEGWVETHPDHRVDAKEDDQWLFACGYYVTR